MQDTFTAEQANISAGNMRNIVDLKDHRGHEATHTYWGLAISKTDKTDVAAAIGISAIVAAAKFGATGRAVGAHLGEVVNRGLLYLAMDDDRWNFDLQEEYIEQARAWLCAGTEHERSRRVQELLDIRERRASRYLMLDRDGLCTTTDDISAVRQPVMLVLDAFSLADEVRRSYAGCLFTIRQKEGG